MRVGPELASYCPARDNPGQIPSLPGAAVMPSPFPGMDPYLEHPEIFPDLHSSLNFCLREAIQSQLPPPYYAVIGRRAWIEVSLRYIEPDVHVLQRGDAPREGGVAVAAKSRSQPTVVHVCIHRFDNLEDYLVYPIQLEQPLPEIEVPLLPGSPAVPVDLQTVFDRCYAAGPYGFEIDYKTAVPVPPLAAGKAQWGRGTAEIELRA
jgi:hypothetical protein